MRNETQVLKQILDYAQSNPAIRCVILNGSRVNPKVVKDIFCDYDVIFGVTDPLLFLENREWIRNFGELIIMQQNVIPMNDTQGQIFLMLFADGVRIDLSFAGVNFLHYWLEDSLTKVLLDKDHLLGEVEPPSERSYVTAKPTKEEFEATLNNIWWCATNVAKGLWREELPYVKSMMDTVIRPDIIAVLSWYAGLHHPCPWQVNVGKFGKWLKRVLPKAIWEAYLKTYSGVDPAEIWEALLATGKLVREIGPELAEQLGYEYPLEDDRRVTEYLQKVRELPKA